MVRWTVVIGCLVSLCLLGCQGQAKQRSRTFASPDLAVKALQTSFAEKDWEACKSCIEYKPEWEEAAAAWHLVSSKWFQLRSDLVEVHGSGAWEQFLEALGNQTGWTVAIEFPETPDKVPVGSFRVSGDEAFFPNENPDFRLVRDEIGWRLDFHYHMAFKRPADAVKFYEAGARGYAKGIELAKNKDEGVEKIAIAVHQEIAKGLQKP